jgi:hypothetical protein
MAIFKIKDADPSTPPLPVEDQFMVKVDRSTPPVHFLSMMKSEGGVLDPGLDSSGPDIFNLLQVVDLAPRVSVVAAAEYERLKREEYLARCFNLADLQAIMASKLPMDVFKRLFKDEDAHLFAWGSVVRDIWGNLWVPYLFFDDYKKPPGEPKEMRILYWRMDYTLLHQARTFLRP